MPSAGTGVAQECIDEFNKLKLGKHIKYIIYKIDGGKVVIDETGSEPEYDVFRKKLLEKADPQFAGKIRPSFAVYDLAYEVDGGQRSKIGLISYSDDNKSHVRAKMVYASSRQQLKQSLNGIAFEVEASDADDLEEAELLKKAKTGRH